MEVKLKEKEKFEDKTVISERPEVNLWNDAFRRMCKNKMAKNSHAILLFLFKDAWLF